MVAAIARGQARFADLGIEADLCLVTPDEDAEAAIVAAAIAFNRSPEDGADAALRWLR
ncbi:hypothetical protein [Micromonospora musae]|uniref:hypothetical protein n=1 Tax=Micromonospora musae TaxID=1894970 RepID=UPI0033CA7B1D